MYFALDGVIIDDLTNGDAAHLAAYHTPVPTDARRRIMKTDGQFAG